MPDDPRGDDRPSPIGQPTRSGNRVHSPPAMPDKYPGFMRPIPVNTRDVEALLKDIILTDQFLLVRWLFSTWNAEAAAIKDQELRNAIRDGNISKAWLERWQRDYAALVNEKLRPAWLATMAAAASGAVPVGEFLVDLNGPAVIRWMDTRSMELATNMLNNQRQAVQLVLRRFISGPVVPNPIVVARYLRPIIGLTRPQELAVARLRQRLIVERLSLRVVEHRVGNYAARLRRLRAETIARTEYSMAFNFGHFEAMRQARDRGLLSDRIIKMWQTAEDEIVCPVCAPLNGQVIDLDDTFPVTGRTSYTPPAHPKCRCTMTFSVMEDSR